VLNELKALPFRNLQRTSDPSAVEISGEKFAEKTLLRNAACAGCPVGCIHLGFVREKFMEPNQYLYRQVSYDHEPIFAVGCMLAVTDPFAALDIMEEADKVGLDVMSAGVALAWATEASEKGIVSAAETLVPLRFGDAAAFQQAMWHLARAENEFYRLLASGTLHAAKRFGGEDFACVLGQEMAGYATGEVFFVSQALGLRHSHLDAGGYSFDQKHTEKDAAKAVEFLISDESSRCFLTSMVSCLFARGVYTDARLAECLKSVGYAKLAEDAAAVSTRIQTERWRLRFATGYDPDRVEIPRRFSEVTTWKGPIDRDYLRNLKSAYGRRTRTLAAPAAIGREDKDEKPEKGSTG
jgi:aldehyde:ferredoxin oxidoreductase